MGGSVETFDDHGNDGTNDTEHTSGDDGSHHSGTNEVDNSGSGSGSDGGSSRPSEPDAVSSPSEKRSR